MTKQTKDMYDVCHRF